MPQADNANASLGFRSIMVQKSLAFHAKHFDPLKSPYCGTQRHNKTKRRHNRLLLECFSYDNTDVHLLSLLVRINMSKILRYCIMMNEVSGIKVIVDISLFHLSTVGL